MMEALLTMSYLVVFFGVIGGVCYGIEALLCAHDRGMARVRAYDSRTGGKHNG
jgi:hypothetical protein